jgi:signal transduction histidine kinase
LTEWELVDAALARERRRLAQELHDGMAQDLAYIASQSAHLAQRSPERELLGHIAGAAQRALSETRAVIDALAAHTIPPQPAIRLADALSDRARELAARSGLELTLDVDASIESTPEVDHAVMRILSEAISNAARHAAATRLCVSLTQERGTLVMRVADDGKGFDPTRRADHARGTGEHGLAGMRERVRLLGGELRLESSPGLGTLVEAGF